MMFNLKKSYPAWVFATLAFTTAHGSTPDRLGVYDFSYQSTGDQRVRPAQVFDDGRSTFFQFRAGEPVPAIFAVTQNGPTLLVPEAEGPYIRVASISAGYVLRLGYGYGKVAYTGTGRSLPSQEAFVPPQRPPSQLAVNRLIAASADIQGLPAEMTAPAPRVALEVNSYATPIKGDRTTWTAPEDTIQEFAIPFVIGKGAIGPASSKLLRSLITPLQAATKIEITGHDDPTYREGTAQARANAIANALAAMGIPRSRLMIKTSTVVVSGESKSVVVGATVKARTASQPSVPDGGDANQKRVPANGQVESIVAQLRNGQMSPSQAARALDGVREGTPQDTGVAGRAVGPWAVKKTDGTVENMLKRWGQDAGWRVLNKGAPTIEIHGDAEVDRREFLHAADYAITQAKQAGYRIKATAYSNNVLVLTGE